MKKGISRCFYLLFNILVLQVLIVIAAPAQADASPANLVLLPSTQNVKTGDTLTVTVQAQCGSQTTDGIETYIDFDSAYLEVQSASPGTALSTVLIPPTFNNTAGTFDFSAGQLISPFPSGTFAVVTVIFQAKIATASHTTITFHTLDPRKTTLDWEGNNITGTLTGGTYTIQDLPAVTAISPTVGAMDVPINSPVALTFSKVMNQSATQSAFSISPPVAGSFNWTNGGTMMTFTPGSDLAYNSTYSIGLDIAATDLGGIHLAAPYGSNFTTVKGSTSISVTSSANPSAYGQSVTFTAIVSAVPPATGTPTGLVTFKEGDTTLGTGNLSGSGQAAFSTTKLAAGSHSITAVYGGDPNYHGSTSTVLTQNVNKASTVITLTSSVNPSTYGQLVTFNVIVSAMPPAVGTPTGIVTLNGPGKLGTWNLSDLGQASCAISVLIVGNHTITAIYGGDTTFAASTISLVQMVDKSSTTITLNSSANPSVYGQSVIFIADVNATSPYAGIPTGTVTFYNDWAVLGTGTLNNAGQAFYTTSTLSIGSHTNSAYYGGDSTNSESTSSELIQIINQSGGGGGGGGGGAPSTITVTTDILSSHPSLKLYSNGAAVTALKTSSPDGKLDISLSAGTIALLAGKPITTFSVTSGNNPAAPPVRTILIGPTYEFGPAGATFNPPFSFAYHFTDADIPPGVLKADLYLAYYDTQTSRWLPLTGIVDTANNTLTSTIAHFTSIAVLAPSAPSFALTGLEVSPAQLVAGGKVTIAVTVDNSGGKTGSYAVALNINGLVDQSSSVSVSAGGSQKVTFVVTRQQPGKYMVKVGELSGSFTVTAPEPSPTPAPITTPAPAPPATPISTPAPTQSPVLAQVTTPPPSPTPAPPPASSASPTPTSAPGVRWGLIGGIVAAVVIVIILIAFAVSKRRKAAL